MAYFKNNLLISIFILTGLTFCNTIAAQQKNKPQPLSGGFLKASGKVVVDEKGSTIILRGMGLGGWMLQEGYMFRLSNLGTQQKIKAAISDVIGPEKTQKFYSDWLAHHTTKADIDSMAAWGFNSVRLPMHYGLYTRAAEDEPAAGQNTWLEKGFALTDSLLSWCKANRMYLILDLHAAPGGQGNDLAIADRDPKKPSLWESEANLQKTVALWRRLAERYAAEPWIGGYDIINEPNWGFEDAKDFRGTAEKKNAPLRRLMMDITKAIREVDQRHLIIIEGNGFGNNYNGIFPLWDENIVVSFHKYGTFNTDEGIQGFLNLQNKWNMPLWLGEAGENSNTWFTEAIRLVESHNIGWSWWQLKKMGINNPLEIREPASYSQLLNYWTKGGAKPSPAEAETVLHELMENVKIRNNIYHRDVTDAMFRQVRSGEALPFKKQVITNGAVVKAVDYDMGPAGVAYSDKDTARYQYASPPSPSAGNRGGAYRNDGVDIQRELTTGPQPGYYVSYIEDGEWLQYTATVARPGNYKVLLTAAAASDSGRLSLYIDDKPVAATSLPNTGGATVWQTVELKGLQLKKGNVRLKIKADKGGFNFKEMQFVKE